MSIRNKLLISCLAIAIVPMFTIAFLSFVHAREALKSARMAELVSIADLKVKMLDDFVRTLKVEAEIARGYINVRTNLPVVTGYAGDRDDPSYLRAKKTLDGQLRHFMRTGGFRDLMLADGKGRVVYTANEAHEDTDMDAPLPAPPGMDFESMKEGVFISGIFPDPVEGEGYMMLITAPVESFEGEFAGFIAFEIDTDPIYDLIQDTTGLGETGETLIGKKKEGYALFLNRLRHDRDSAMKRRANFGDRSAFPMQEAVNGRSGAGVQVDYRGEESVAAWRHIPSMDWGLVAKIDTSEAFYPIRRLRRFTALIGVLAVGLVIIVTINIVRSIASPLGALQRGIEEIGEGDLDYRVEVDTKDEIGALADAFNRMTDNLRAMTASRDELDREVVERMRTEERLKESQAQLVQSEKMSAVGTLVAGVAHELNNPMMGILNFIQYCKKRTPEDDKRHGVLADAERETLRCQDIVTNLLTFSRMDKEGEEGRTLESVETLFDRVFKLLAYRMGMLRVELNRHRAEDTPDVWMKANSIQQVFFNLVNNALDAMETAGRKEIDVDIRPEGGFVRVTVADTGQGIAQQDMPSIFEAFYTTKPAGKGTGLGLSMCRSIVIEHGGDITCESKAGGGTTFTVLLPVDLRKGGKK